MLCDFSLNCQLSLVGLAYDRCAWTAPHGKFQCFSAEKRPVRTSFVSCASTPSPAMEGISSEFSLGSNVFSTAINYIRSCSLAVHGGIGIGLMRSGPSLGRFHSVAFEAVPEFVRRTMALSRPFKGDCRTLLLSTPLCSRRSMG